MPFWGEIFCSVLLRNGRRQWLVFDPKSALEMLILGAVELQIRPNGWWLVYFIPNKRIGNAHTLAGRIANSHERVVAGVFYSA